MQNDAHLPRNLIIFSTSDSSNPDVLLVSKVRNLKVSGADWALIASERSHDREWIGSRSGADWERIPSHSCDLSEPIRGSESQSGSPPNPLSRGSAPKSHVISLSQSDRSDVREILDFLLGVKLRHESTLLIKINRSLRD